MSTQTAVASAVLEIRVRLRTNKSIWRELVVPAEATLSELHEAIERAFHWSGGHRHLFSQGATDYGRPGPDAPDGMLDESVTRVGEVLTDPGDALLYLYESSEEWCHDIRLMSVCESEGWESGVACVRGEGACPPTDMSAPAGFDESFLILPHTLYDLFPEMVGIAGLPTQEADYCVGSPEILTGPMQGM